MGVIATTAALIVCVFVLAMAIMLDRRPYRPGKVNLVPLMIISLAGCLVLGRHLLALIM